LIELFKTHCKLPDGSIGEVCKKMKNELLVCNSGGWWLCEESWVLENLIESESK
jgi:hypothetical protein